MFDNLKNIKKDIVQNEQKSNEKIEKDLKDKKENNLKIDFLSFMENSGIKKTK